jgi:hypothetical protein
MKSFNLGLRVFIAGSFLKCPVTDPSRLKLWRAITIQGEKKQLLEKRAIARSEERNVKNKER